MAGKGGYQRPEKPATVSGPGKYSQRTDGGPSVADAKQAAQYISGMPYGEGQEINNIAQSAPMAAAPAAPTASPLDAMAAMQTPSTVTPFSAPTERPNEPVTTGVPVGPGSDALSANVTAPAVALSAADKEKSLMILGILQQAADRPDASLATRNMLRRLRGML